MTTSTVTFDNGIHITQTEVEDLRYDLAQRAWVGTYQANTDTGNPKTYVRRQITIPRETVKWISKPVEPKGYVG